MFWQPTRGILQPGQHWRRGQDAGGGGTSTTFNPSDKAASANLAPGAGGVANLTLTSSSGTGGVRSISSYSSGKYYAEFTIGTTNASSYSRGVGIANNSASLTGVGGDANSGVLFMGDPLFYLNSGSTTTGLTYTNNDVVGMAVDLDNNRIWYRRNGGDWNNNVSNDPAANVGGLAIAAPARPVFVFANVAASGAALTANFGAAAYSSAPPSGFGNW